VFGLRKKGAAVGLLGGRAGSARGRRNQRVEGERPVSVFDNGQGGHDRPLVLGAERGRPWRPVCSGV
jgi:hypothetical protein